MKCGFAVIVQYTMKAGLLERFLRDWQALSIGKKTRHEPGCLKYELSVCVERENTLQLVECWETRSAQKAHTNQPHFAQLMRLKAECVEKSTAEYFDLAT